MEISVPIEDDYQCLDLPRDTYSDIYTWLQQEISDNNLEKKLKLLLNGRCKKSQTRDAQSLLNIISKRVKFSKDCPFNTVEFVSGAIATSGDYADVLDEDDGSVEVLWIRRLMWSFLLGVVRGSDVASWLQQVRSNRGKYKEMQAGQTLSASRLCALDPQRFHPLANSQDNPWIQKQRDEELREEIRKDVKRTFAERDLFCSERVQRAIESVLVLWAKLNPEVSYRQGMNEILAHILLVCCRDSLKVETSTLANQSSGGATAEYSSVEYLYEVEQYTSADFAETIQVLLSSNFDDIEADVYFIFDKLMTDRGLIYMYAPVPPAPANVSPDLRVQSYVLSGKPITSVAGGPLGVQRFASSSATASVSLSAAMSSPQSAVLVRCTDIFEKNLARCDPAVYRHLQKQKVEPQVYLLKWLRLLFSREFHLEDSLLIWDAIFADAFLENHMHALAIPEACSIKRLSSASSATAAAAAALAANASENKHRTDLHAIHSSLSLPLCNSLCVSMILYIRERLLNGDSTGCMWSLLKYPPIENVFTLISVALSVREVCVGRLDPIQLLSGHINAGGEDARMALQNSISSSGIKPRPPTISSIQTPVIDPLCATACARVSHVSAKTNGKINLTKSTNTPRDTRTPPIGVFGCAADCHWGAQSVLPYSESKPQAISDFPTMTGKYVNSAESAKICDTTDPAIKRTISSKEGPKEYKERLCESLAFIRLAVGAALREDKDKCSDILQAVQMDLEALQTAILETVIHVPQLISPGVVKEATETRLKKSVAAVEDTESASSL